MSENDLVATDTNVGGTDTISRQAAIELFKDDIAAVNELNNLPPLPDRMKYVQESVNTIMNTCKSDSIKDKAFRNAARMIQNVIDGEAPDFETIEELPSAQPDIPDMNVIIDTIKNAINASTGNDAYTVGLRNGMRWCLSALTDKEPEYEDMPSEQRSLYGYDLRNLIVFADAVNKKGISDSEIEDFVRNARAAWEYAWEEFQRVQKEALKQTLKNRGMGGQDE